MATNLNRTKEVLNKLEAENKIEFLNKAEDLVLLSSFDSRMEETRSDYQIKERNSQISAASVILTA